MNIYIRNYQHLFVKDFKSIKEVFLLLNYFKMLVLEQQIVLFSLLNIINSNIHSSKFTSIAGKLISSIAIL